MRKARVQTVEDRANEKKSKMKSENAKLCSYASIVRYTPGYITVGHQPMRTSELLHEIVC